MGTLSRSTFRTLASRVLARVLGEAGFEPREKLYVRRIDQQVHALELQVDELEFTFNFAFHYEFLPSFSRGPSPERRREKAVDAFTLPDFLMSTRLGRFESDYKNAYKDQMYPIGQNPDDAIGLVEQKAALAVNVCQDLRRRWADPAAFLKTLTPDVVLSEVVIPEKVTGELEGGRLSDFILYPFFPSAIVLSEFLEIVAQRVGDAPLAGEYARARETLVSRYKKRGWL